MKSQGAFRVLTDTYVTDDSGTGVVHQAPFFGAVSIISFNANSGCGYAHDCDECS